MKRELTEQRSASVREALSVPIARANRGLIAHDSARAHHSYGRGEVGLGTRGRMREFTRGGYMKHVLSRSHEEQVAAHNRCGPADPVVRPQMIAVERGFLQKHGARDLRRQNLAATIQR